MKPEWVSVKDKLPKHGQEILATDGKNINICWCDIGSSNYLFMINCIEQFINIKYWMELPEIPK